MAFRNRNRLQCYVCDAIVRPGQLARIDGDDNLNKCEIAISRRDANNRPALDITARTRLCVNCNRSILNEIEAIERDPTCLRLNVLTQTSSHTCMICNQYANIQRLSVECRVNIFVIRNIYIPETTKCCNIHLDHNGLLLQYLLGGLKFVNRPYVIRGQQLQIILQELRRANQNSCSYNDENSFTDEEFKSITPISQNQFRELYTFCDPVSRIDGKGYRYISKRDLLLFLCKLRQGLSDEFLKVIFHYPSRQTVSLTIQTVRRSLMQRFVPQNIGFQAITRNEFIERHVTDFANGLYNPQPNEPRIIAYIDGTYAYIHKSSNFRILRQSYCRHKGRHLVKPALIVAPDGYILTIQGPYFSDSRNNDAEMLRNEYARDGDAMRAWFQDGDIFVVDRGYRDTMPMLEALGIHVKMPPILEPGQRQFSTEQANKSRLVTKTRWIIEARNDHIKSVFKFFAQTVIMPHVTNLGDFFRIAGAIINRYHPLVHMEGANFQLAQQLLARAQEPNVVQARVEMENLRTRNARWIRLNHNQVNDFPHLDIDYLRDLTVGIYQVYLAAGYIQDRLQREDKEFHIDMLTNEHGFLRVRQYSRFRNATTHQLWIAYNAIHNENNIDDENNIDHKHILGYYCTCQSGARIVGCCAHVASVIWFLGYARHQPNIRYLKHLYFIRS
ncbi:uncharacterized protein LOC105255738 [Camponotus floridanus]|uniref:uncharacterized protein LOC105255738 n=1 Tax=Camponotus floridanus TaxID=104421 RepID=UPI000DC68A1A|nr:uncharacterized protein LOC105255738 [Camponotus floridanus]